MTEDLGGGEVDEVPVVGALGVLEIKGEDFIATADGNLIVTEAFGGQFLKLRHEDEQSAETDFVPAAHKQFGDFAQGEVFPDSLDHFSRLGHFQPKKLITLTVLAGPRLEESHEYLSLGIVLLRLHISDYFLSCRHLLKIEN